MNDPMVSIWLDRKPAPTSAVKTLAGLNFDSGVVTWAVTDALRIYVDRQLVATVPKDQFVALLQDIAGALPR